MESARGRRRVCEMVYRVRERGRRGLWRSSPGRAKPKQEGVAGSPPLSPRHCSLFWSLVWDGGVLHILCKK